MPQDKKQHPPRSPAALKPSRPQAPQPVRQPPPRSTFNLGGRRFNGQSLRRGTRH